MFALRLTYSAGAQTLDHIQMAKVFLVSYPRPVNMWLLTAHLAKTVGAQGLVGPPPPISCMRSR